MKTNTPIPNKFKVTKSNDEVTISFRWFSWHYIFFVLLCFTANVFFIYLYYFSVIVGSIQFPASYLIFISIIIVPLNYYILSYVFNTTTIKLSKDHIQFVIFPISLFWIARTIKINDFRQFSIVKKKESGRNRYDTVYVLNAVNFRHKSFFLYKFEFENEANFVKETIEKFYNIPFWLRE